MSDTLRSQHAHPSFAQFALWFGPLAAMAVFALTYSWGLPSNASWTAAITTLCAVWWVLEAIPIPATSLIPFACFPLCGVLSHREVAQAYGHTLILLLLGGFMLSTAMEKNDAHRRVALGMIRAVGGRGGKRLVLGFMLACAFLSMWISNTATVLMLLPVALAVIRQSEDSKLAAPLLLGLAYSASIGGLGTPVGTPPNVIFMGIYRETTGTEISFLEWMKIGVPAVLLFLPIAWLWVTRTLRSSEVLRLPTLGAWQTCEKRVLIIFALTALLWITRSEPLGGWSGLFGVTTAGDSTIALLAVVVLFLTPDGRGSRLLDWPTAAKIPWGILILFGGGLAIAKAFETSGLSQTLGEALSTVTSLPILLVVLIICLGVTFLTEITSNTATTTLLLPILAAAALVSGISPELLMVPATLSASCAFMLPVATAPNAIVFGSEQVSIKTMAREGFFLNLVGAAVIVFISWLLLV